MTSTEIKQLIEKQRHFFYSGATVKLKGFQEFDRKYKITKATHKLTGGYTTAIELKQVLEGY